MDKIVIIDDDHLALQFLSQLVNLAGYTPLSLIDSTHLFEVLEKEQIKLILLDIYMPDEDGFAVLQRVKQHPQFQAIPIIMLTADTKDETLETCFKLGANDYITKPIRPLELHARIQVAISNFNYINKLHLLSERMAEFVGVVSHDLRNPLGLIKTYCDLFNNKNLPGASNFSDAEIIEVIQRQNRISLELVSDLLDLTAMETGKVKIDLSLMKLNSIVEQAVISCSHLAQAKHIEIMVNLEPHGSVEIDHKRMSQVMGNLLTNAIKFTQPGGQIEIQVQNQPTGVLVSVRDNGVGIKEENQASLFMKHRKISTMGTQGEPGTGFGLPLSQELVKAHNTILQVKSAPDEGSTFYFYLPHPASKNDAAVPTKLDH